MFWKLLIKLVLVPLMFIVKMQRSKILYLFLLTFNTQKLLVLSKEHVELVVCRPFICILAYMQWYVKIKYEDYNYLAFFFSLSCSFWKNLTQNSMKMINF